MRLPLALIVLVLGVWAIVAVLGSRARFGAKLLWIAGIVALPVVGFMAWLFKGPRAARARRR